MNDDISHFYPTLEWKHLKQSQHGISYIIKVKITRVGPVKAKDTLIYDCRGKKTNKE